MLEPCYISLRSILFADWLTIFFFQITNVLQMSHKLYLNRSHHISSPSSIKILWDLSDNIKMSIKLSIVTISNVIWYRSVLITCRRSLSDVKNVNCQQCQKLTMSNVTNVKCQNQYLYLHTSGWIHQDLMSQYQMSCVIRVCRITQRIDYVPIFSIYFVMKGLFRGQKTRWAGLKHLVNVCSAFTNALFTPAGQLKQC